MWVRFPPPAPTFAERPLRSQLRLAKLKPSIRACSELRLASHDDGWSTEAHCAKVDVQVVGASLTVQIVPFLSLSRTSAPKAASVDDSQGLS